MQQDTWRQPPAPSLVQPGSQEGGQGPFTRPFGQVRPPLLQVSHTPIVTQSLRSSHTCFGGVLMHK